MAEKIKFTNEELVAIREIQQKYNDLTVRLGQFSLQRFQLVNRLTELDINEEKAKEDLKNIQKDEQVLAQQLQAKYGEGQLNPDTGEFLPREK